MKTSANKEVDSRQPYCEQ